MPFFKLARVHFTLPNMLSHDRDAVKEWWWCAWYRTSPSLDDKDCEWTLGSFAFLVILVQRASGSPPKHAGEWSFHVSLLLSHGGQGRFCRFSVCRRKCTGDDLRYHCRRVAPQTSRGERVINDSRNVCHFSNLFFYLGRLKIVLTVIGIREEIDLHKVKEDSARGGFSRCTWDKLGFASVCGSWGTFL